MMAEKTVEGEKLKIDKEGVSATVFPRKEGENIQPVAIITQKPKPHQRTNKTHYYERPISESTAGGFGFNAGEVDEINEHLSRLRSKYFNRIEN